METQVTRYHHSDLVKLSGRLDDLGVDSAGAAFQSVIDAKRYQIVVDMSEVNFVSSKGWWLLINVQKQCKKNGHGEVVLVNLDPKIEKSLNMVGMKDYFKLFPDVVSAIGNF